MCTQTKERDETTGHEAREDMKEKRRKKVCEGETRRKKGNQMKGTETNESQTSLRTYCKDLG